MGELEEHAMTPLFRHLQRLQERAAQIRVGVIGAGLMGRGLVHQLVRMPGMAPSLVVARDVERAISAYRAAGLKTSDIVATDDPVCLSAAMWKGLPAVTTDIELAAEVAPVDVFIDCTGAVEYGARAALACIRNGRHFVSLNAEADATVGCALKQEADRAGVVYTNSDGDQPGVLMRLIEYCRALGFEVRAAVNCKGFMDIHATPDSILPWALKQNTSPRMTASFTDGTKINLEMNVICNAAGLKPGRRGMAGVRTDLKNALADFARAGALAGDPTVAYTLGGDFGGGVFVIARAADPQFAAPYFSYFKMGDGPDYLFFRPYHLCQFEAPLSAAEAVLYSEPTIAPLGEPVAQTLALAKCPLKAGEMLDGIGGHMCYGEVDTVENARGLLPIGLADGVRLTRDLERGEPIPMDAVDLDDSSLLVRLWRRQQAPARAAAPIAA
jgi:predicted homoserine dehydrogenase-like protein